MKKIVRYNCIGGYIDDEEGTYQIGDRVEGINEVQSITYPCPVCGDIDCIC